ncbi:NB-ARC domain-containing protein [Streptomyces sudanensis]|nr:NB-ARC domain-containing protein [Streptomyces sudanensis]
MTRALRPWKRPWPEGRRGALDIEATVDGYARSGELLPVFSAAPERWFDLTLVVDRSPTMRVWEETLGDFAAVLDRLGAFRTLRVRDLLFDGAGRPRAPGQLRQADGRRLVVVVSDCASEPWRAPPVWRLLREWASTTPTALLNPLPAKLWRRGGLNLPTVRFAPAAPGTHRSRVPHEPPALLDPTGPDGAPLGGTAAGPDTGRDDAGQGAAAAWLPVPVLSLSPHSLDRWSRAVMRGAPEGCTAVLVPPGGRLPGRSRPRAVPLPPGEAARGFLRTAAPRAVRLAVLCAPFDRFSLRLLHVIRRELVPDATTADVAEAVTSGLFELEQPAGGSGPLELVLPEEARAVLRERLPAHEAWRVHRALDRHVASLGDGRPGPRSVAHDASGPLELPAEREAFARASRRTLELLGLAAPGEGTAAPGRAAPEGGAGEPGAFPPPPERFVGREHAVDSLLARLADPAAGTVWVTAAGDGPGAGRTALALHVAHRFPGERHYVDMRGSGGHPVPPEAALHRLLASLGTSGDGEARTAEELAAGLARAVAGRRVLLVLDDVPEPARMEQLLPSVPGCAVLATTRSTDAPPGYRLMPLSDRGAADLLAAWAGAEGSEERAALREVTAGRSWLPLTLRVLGSWIASGSAPPLPELARLIRRAGAGTSRPLPQKDFETVFDLRLRALPAREQEALRRFVLAPTGELTRTEAWALLGDDRTARAVLGRLSAAGLLDRRGAGTYRVPEAVRLVVAREVGYEMLMEPSLRRLIGHYLARAAALYEEDHPGSALTENLRTRASGAADDPASRHVWLDNALALATTADALPPEHLAALLLLLHACGASPPYRSRFEAAADAVIRVSATWSREATVRPVVALALAQHAAGAVAEAALTLKRVPGDWWDRDGAVRGPANRLAGQLAAARGPRPRPKGS